MLSKSPSVIYGVWPFQLRLLEDVGSLPLSHTHALRVMGFESISESLPTPSPIDPERATQALPRRERQALPKESRLEIGSASRASSAGFAPKEASHRPS